MFIKEDLPISPSSVKTRFTYKFLSELNKLNNNKPTSPSVKERYRRYHKVKIAAYASMASAVGSRRRWSRVLLWKIRNRGFRQAALVKRDKRIRRRRRIGGNPRKDDGDVRRLQKLIPGGEGMDSCSLLDETADYIKCLSMQVKIMRNILNVCSN